MKISKVINMLMKSIDKDIEIVIDNEFTKFIFDFDLSTCLVSNRPRRRFRMKKQKRKWRMRVYNWCFPPWFAERNPGRTYSSECTQIRM